MEKLLDYLYTEASKRIRKRKNEYNKTITEIYPKDPKIISSIINYQHSHKLQKNNPNFIRQSVLFDSDNIYGIVPVLKFENEIEVLWGNNNEIEDNLFDIFKLLFEMCENSRKKDKIDTEYILCDYVKYAKYYSYFHLLTTKNEILIPFVYYGIKEDDVMNNIETSKEEAILFLFKKLKDDFLIIYKNFIKDNNSFHYIWKEILNNLYGDKFINLLKKYSPKEESLGLRVRNIILSDFKNIPSQIKNYYIKGELNTNLQALNYASSQYILALEEIQKNKG